MGKNVAVIREPKTRIDVTKRCYKNLKYEIEFIIKHNESLIENKMKNEVRKLLFKYKHGNDIQEHRKQQNE